MLLIDREDHSLEAHIDYEIEFLFRIDQIDNGVSIVGGSFLAGVEGDGAGDVVQVVVVFDDPADLLLGSVWARGIPHDVFAAELDWFLEDEDILILEAEQLHLSYGLSIDQ